MPPDRIDHPAAGGSYILPGILAFAIASTCILARLGELPLLQPDEGRNAEVAREMLASGSWVIPTFDELTYLDKPAFYFRTVALSFTLFGESELAARIPSALFGLTLLGLIYAFCRREYGGLTAAFSVGVVGTTPLYIAFSRIVIFDVALALFVCAAIFAGYTAEADIGTARARWYRLGAASAGLATLVKGPVGFIVPALVLLVFFRANGHRGAARRLLAPLNIAIFLAIVSPWFVGVTIQHPDFAYYGLVRESVARFTTTAFRRTAPAYYYAPVIAAVFFPWSVLLPEAVVAAWRARARWTRADRLFVTWAAVVVVFFSISQSKLPGYVLTAVIALGVLVARLFAIAIEAPHGRATTVVRHGLVVLGALSVAVAMLFAAELHTPGTLHRLFRIRADELEAIAPAFTSLLWTFGVGGVIALVAALRVRSDARWGAAIAFMLLPVSFVTVVFEGVRQYAESRSGRLLATKLQALAPGVDVACLECFPTGLPFYLKRPVTIISRDGRETTSNYVMFSLSRTSTWPAVIVPFGSRDRWLADREQPVLLISYPGRRASLDSLGGQVGAGPIELMPGWWGVLLPFGTRH